METQGAPYSQEVSFATISRRKNGNRFLGLRKCSAFGDTYDSRIVALRENIKQKRRIKLSDGVLLLHDNVPAHMSRTSLAVIRKCGFVKLNHPPYSPDLAPSDYFLFRNIHKFLCGRQFPDDNAVKEAVTGYFDTQDVSFFSEGSLFDHWRRRNCVTITGGYIEK